MKINVFFRERWLILLEDECFHKAFRNCSTSPTHYLYGRVTVWTCIGLILLSLRIQVYVQMNIYKTGCQICNSQQRITPEHRVPRSQEYSGSIYFAAHIIFNVESGNVVNVLSC